MPRKSYTPAERALHILGTLAGKDHHQINCFIIQGDARKEVPKGREKLLPEGSLDMLKRRYVPHFVGYERMMLTEDWEVLWDHCVAPKKIGDL